MLLEPIHLLFYCWHLTCLCNAGIAGYIKLQRQTRCQQENKRCEETTQKQKFRKHCGIMPDWGLTYNKTRESIIKQCPNSHP